MPGEDGYAYPSAVRLKEESYTSNLGHMNKHKRLNCRCSYWRNQLFKNPNRLSKSTCLLNGVGTLFLCLNKLICISLVYLISTTCLYFHQVLHFQSREQSSNTDNPMVILAKVTCRISTRGTEWVKKHGHELLQRSLKPASCSLPQREGRQQPGNKSLFR